MGTVLCVCIVYKTKLKLLILQQCRQAAGAAVKDAVAHVKVQEHGGGQQPHASPVVANL